jgi:hypothetical protein
MKLRTNAMPPDATSKARVFKIHTIAVVHACNVEGKSSSIYRFFKISSALNFGETGSLVKEIFCGMQNNKIIVIQNFI